MRYAVTITPDSGAFVVTFPDVPEAITYGDTVEEALSRAPDALMTIFDAFMKDRRDIPAPTASTKDHAVELPSLETTKIELYRTMRAAGVGKAELAKRLNWHMPQVDRVLDVHHGSKLDQIEAAFEALGKRLSIIVQDGPRAATRAGEVSLRASSPHHSVARRTVPRVHGAIIESAARERRGRRVHSRATGTRVRARKAAKKR